MKTMKKLASVALALVMALCLTVPAFATEPEPKTNDGKITIENAEEGQTYTAYQVFELESFSGTAYSYKVNDTWKAFVQAEDTENNVTAGPGAAYVTVDDQGYVTWKAATDAETAQAFAKLALAYAKDNNITGVEGTISEDKVVFNDLPLGYYLIDSSLGALCSLNTTDKEVTMKEKNEKPTDKKESEMPENSKVGTDITYTITINAKKGAEAYVVHDTMSTSLTFKPDTLKVTATPVVSEGETAVTVDVDPANYSLTVSTEEAPLTDGCTFELAFDQDYLDTLAGNTTIVIKYSATINANAVIGKDPITNKEILSYGDGNKTIETPGTITEDDLYEFDIVKTNSDERGREVLPGAQFKLYDVATDGDPIILRYVEDAENGNYYRPATTEEIDDEAITTTTTIDAGVATIKGLGAGTYYLEETKQPDGYNKMNGRQAVALSADLKATVEDGKYKADVADDPATEENEAFTNSGVRVINYTGAELPSTGGIGTTIFYIVGGLLAVGAGVLLVTKKKMGADDE